MDFTPIRVLDGGRNLSQVDDLKFGTFNVLNLEFSPGKYLDNPTTGAREFKPGTITKDKEHVKEIAQAIQEEDLDMIVLQEVEGYAPLQAFNKKYLGDNYEVFIQKGNDSRGIEIGFLVKKDLPFKVRMQSHSKRKWVNPNTGEETFIFSRDLPALHIRQKTTSMNDPPDMIFMGTHYKSQRASSGDPRSVKKRQRQVEETQTILSDFEKAYPETPIFLGGDFNADLHSSSEFKSLFESGDFVDSFDLLKRKPKKEERVTHTFHPRNGDTKYNQLDAILVNEKAASSVQDAKVYRYKDQSGSTKPIPKTYEERKINPSDHFMVVMRARTSSIFQKVRP